MPAALRPPVELALAKAVESIPRAGALPGGNVYEMKWDGFRAVCLVDVDGVSLWSRQGKDLSRYFPDALAAVTEQIPTGCVVDGELVVWSGDRLDFDALQRRLVTARAALPAVVRERPASFVAFDVLAARCPRAAVPGPAGVARGAGACVGSAVERVSGDQGPGGCGDVV